jgi:hypothetical protein
MHLLVVKSTLDVNLNSETIARLEQQLNELDQAIDEARNNVDAAYENNENFWKELVTPLFEDERQLNEYKRKLKEDERQSNKKFLRVADILLSRHEKRLEDLENERELLKEKLESLGITKKRTNRLARNTI